LDGLLWPTVEHYFQAQKFLDNEDYRELVRTASNPGVAKRLGGTRDLALRSDWQEVKEKFMRDALIAKFTEHDDLRAKLIATGGKKLVERSDFDDYWGDGKKGFGKNRLGHLLMEVRELMASNLFAPKKIETDSEATEADEKDEASPPPLVVPAPVSSAPVKAKSHTTAMDRAIKRKNKNRGRRNVWKDDTGASVFQIDNSDPQKAILFKDSDVTVPMSALPEAAKHVMRKHQYVLKYADVLDGDDFDDYEENERDSSDGTSDESIDSAALPTKRLALGAFLPDDHDHIIPLAEFKNASDCIATAKTHIVQMSAYSPYHDEYKAHRQQCLEILPVLFGFVEMPQSDSVMMELLETIDALNTCSAV